MFESVKSPWYIIMNFYQLSSSFKREVDREHSFLLSLKLPEVSIYSCWLWDVLAEPSQDFLRGQEES